MLTLDRGAAAPLRTQLEQQLREAIRGGSLVPGVALPSTRALAGELAVSRGLVVEAYAQLSAEGYLVTRAGGGTRVARVAGARASAAAPAAVPPAPRYDFRPGAPDVALFPMRAWLASVRRGLAGAPHARFDYGDPRGAPELRATLAEYLGRVRGVVAHPDALVVTSGLAQGLALLARALVARGVRRIGVEDPGSAPLRDQVQAAGLVRRRAPRRRGRRARRTGSATCRPWCSPRRTSSPPASCSPRNGARPCSSGPARTGALVIEDDYDAEYRYDRPPVGALQGLDPRNVVYSGSASKTLAPALRLGWLVVPERLADEVAAQKAADDLGTPVVDQLALADFIAHGELDRHLRTSRLEYRRRRDTLVAALARHVPEARVAGIAAGLHVAVYLPGDTDEPRVLEAARARGLGVFGLSEHRTAPGPPALLLGYGRDPARGDRRRDPRAGARYRSALIRMLRHPDTRPAGGAVEHHGSESYFVLGEGLLSESLDGRGAPAVAAAAAVAPFRFSRMGPRGQGKQLGEPNHRKIAVAMTRGQGGVGTIPAGFTYLGQFVDHDLTFDKTEVSLGTNIPPSQLLQARSPSLDLDSLYGAGPGDPESAKFYSDGMRLKMGTTDPFGDIPAKPGHDLPRVGGSGSKAKKRKAQIPDRRNDENLAVAQTHLAFIRFHNRIVDSLPNSLPPRAALHPGARHRGEALPVDAADRLSHPDLPGIRGQRRLQQRPQGVRGRGDADRRPDHADRVLRRRVPARARDDPPGL